MSTAIQAKSLSINGDGILNQPRTQLCYFIQKNSPFAVRNPSFSRISYKSEGNMKTKLTDEEGKL